MTRPTLETQKRIDKWVDISVTATLMVYALAVTAFAAAPLIPGQTDIIAGELSAIVLAGAALIALTLRLVERLRNRALRWIAWTAPLATAAAGLWAFYGFTVFGSRAFPAGFNISLDLFLMVGIIGAALIYVVQPSFRRRDAL